MDSFTNLISNLTPMTTALIIGAVITIILAISNSSYVKYLSSPGPWGVPILGYYPFLPKTKQHIPLKKLIKKYGDAYLITLCGKVYLHLGSYKAVREAFVTKSDYFAGRTEDLNFFMDLFKDSIFVKNGAAWTAWKKFIKQSMREIGLGTGAQLTTPIQDAIVNILKEIQKSGDNEINVSELLFKQCTEVIRRLVIGDNVSDRNIEDFKENFKKLITPIVKFESVLCGKLGRYMASRKLEEIQDTYKAKEELYRILDEILKDHVKTLDMNDPKDMIDLYLREKETMTRKGDPSLQHLTNEAFYQTLIQMYGDGGFTVGSFIAFFVKKLAQLPDVQDAIYSEISENIGIDRLPSADDREKLPYTNAALKELMRMTEAFILIPSLECKVPTTVSGVNVPKGAIALVNFQAVNFDPVLYKNPEKFDANRYLLPENSLNNKTNAPLIFGIGKRNCLGEHLVQAELFLITIAIVQKFKFKLANEEEFIKKANDPDYFENPILEEYRITATPRKLN